MGFPPFQIGSAALEGLHEADLTVQYDTESLIHVWDALVRAVPAMRVYFPQIAARFETAEDGRARPDDVELLDTMLTFGRFVPPEGSRNPGDAVCYGPADSSPVEGDWVVAISATEVLGPDKSWTTFQRTKAPGRKPRLVWRPGPMPVLDPGTPLGAFWGPGLCRYRELHSRTWHPLGAYEALDVICRDLPLPTGSVADLVAALGPAAVEGVDPTSLPPGAVLLDPGKDMLAVVSPGGITLAMVNAAEWRLVDTAKTRFPRSWTPA